MKKTEKKLRIKKNLILPTILLMASLLVTIIFCIYTYSKDHTDSVNYTEKTKVDYSVCLKENNYFGNQCLDSNKTSIIPIADLIDTINIDFSYLMNLSTTVKQDYTYNITAQVVATSKEDESKVIYDKKELLVKNQKVTDEKSSNAAINKKIKIKYGEYNTIITNLKKDYVLALDANLIITMNIRYNGQYTEEFDPISSNKQMSIVIPLSEQTIAIETVGDNSNTTNTLYKNVDEKYSLAILLVLIAINFVVAIVMIISIIKSIPYKKEYHKKLDRILKEYDRAIVSTTKLPSFKGYNLISIPTFEELLDARENLEKPILMYQSKQEDATTFCIMTDKEVYIFILEAVVKEEKKNEKKEGKNKKS